MYACSAFKVYLTLFTEHLRHGAPVGALAVACRIHFSRKHLLLASVALVVSLPDPFSSLFTRAIFWLAVAVEKTTDMSIGLQPAAGLCSRFKILRFFKI
jgi:hypothetical protein